MTTSRTQRTRRRSFASLGGYSAIAQRWGLRLCTCGSWVDRSGRKRYSTGNHETGWTAYRMGVIHWRDRPITRRGLYRFLKLVATTNVFEHDRLNRLVTINLLAYDLARELGVRFPREFADRDRARIRLWLGRSQTTDRRVRTWATA